MALLVSCFSCDKQVSQTARACPHCGQRKPGKFAPKGKQKTSLFTWIAALFLGFGFIGAVTGMNGNHSPSMTTSAMPIAATGKGTANPANDWMLAQSSKGQAERLGKVVGDGCRGKVPFYRGVSSPEKASLPGTENDAFWSVKCTDGRSFEVEINPHGSGRVLVSVRDQSMQNQLVAVSRRRAASQ